MKNTKPFIMMQHQSKDQSSIRALAQKEIGLVSGAGPKDKTVETVCAGSERKYGEPACVTNIDESWECN